MSEEQDKTLKHKCGYIAIVGMPNAGKSTLMNRYLQEKVSIVTPKPQTTRQNVTCILSGDTHQVIFIDTPGILKPRYRMQEVMASFVNTAIGESDFVLLLVDAADFDIENHPQITAFVKGVKNKRSSLPSIKLMTS